MPSWKITPSPFPSPTWSLPHHLQHLSMLIAPTTRKTAHNPHITDLLFWKFGTDDGISITDHEGRNPCTYSTRCCHASASGGGAR